MKEKNNQQQVTTAKKAVITNFFYNSVIVLLTAIIIFLIYSIFTKFNKDETIEETTVSNVGKPAEVIQVEVLNGSDIPGVAERFSDFLRNKKADVISMSNYYKRDMLNTTVIDRRGNLANAYEIAKKLGIKQENVIQQVNEDYLVDVTVIIGRDYNSLKPFK